MGQPAAVALQSRDHGDSSGPEHGARQETGPRLLLQARHKRPSARQVSATGTQ